MLRFKFFTLEKFLFNLSFQHSTCKNISFCNFQTAGHVNNLIKERNVNQTHSWKWTGSMLGMAKFYQAVARIAAAQLFVHRAAETGENCGLLVCTLLCNVISSNSVLIAPSLGGGPPPFPFRLKSEVKVRVLPYEWNFAQKISKIMHFCPEFLKISRPDERIYQIFED